MLVLRFEQDYVTVSVIENGMNIALGVPCTLISEYRIRTDNLSTFLNRYFERYRYHVKQFKPVDMILRLEGRAKPYEWSLTPDVPSSTYEDDLAMMHNVKNVGPEDWFTVFQEYERQATQENSLTATPNIVSLLSLETDNEDTRSNKFDFIRIEQVIIHIGSEALTCQVTDHCQEEKHQLIILPPKTLHSGDTAMEERMSALQIVNQSPWQHESSTEKLSTGFNYGTTFVVASICKPKNQLTGVLSLCGSLNVSAGGNDVALYPGRPGIFRCAGFTGLQKFGGGTKVFARHVAYSTGCVRNRPYSNSSYNE